MSGWRGVGAELQALRDEMHDERVRAYDRELVLWSELARMREAWKAAVKVRSVARQGEEVVTVMVRTREDGSRVHRIVEPSPERAHALAALPDDQVAKLHGLGPKGAIR